MSIDTGGTRMASAALRNKKFKVPSVWVGLEISSVGKGAITGVLDALIQDQLEELQEAIRDDWGNDSVKRIVHTLIDADQLSSVLGPITGDDITDLMRDRMHDAGMSWNEAGNVLEIVWKERGF